MSCGTSLALLTTQPDLSIAEISTTRGFIGRQRELAQLNEALQDALSGQGRLVMLAGEPGIGKTRAVQELATYAKGQGFQVFWTRCYEDEGAPPYWPWVQLIRSALSQPDLELLRAEVGSGIAEIVELLPELKDTFPETSPLQNLPPEQARFRLFDALASLFKFLAQSRPTILVLDDLHWADRSSLMLLLFLIRQLTGITLLVVGTYRDTELSRGHPLTETLAQLSREPAFQRQILRGLNPDDIGSFIQVVLGAAPSPELVQTIHAHTEGNPFFLTEVVHLLSEQIDPSSGVLSNLSSLRIPESVREVIGQRLNRLSTQCNQTLTTASVLGRQFSFTQLVPLMENLSEDQLLEVMEEALSARLIEEVPESREQYQFTHALIQESLVSELSSARRMRMHARVAQALEILYALDVDHHASELAYHFTEAEPVTGPEKLAHYSLLAGQQALAAHAFEEALGHFESALAVREGNAIDGELASLLFGLGQCQTALLDRRQMYRAVANLRQALDYYAAAGDVEHAVAVAEALPIPVLMTEIGDVTTDLRNALRLVDPDSHNAGRLLYRYGNALGTEESNYQAAKEAFDRALNIAQREGDVALEIRTLVDAGRVDGMNLHWSESLEKSLRAIELLRRVNDPSSEVPSRHWATMALMVSADLQTAKAHALASLAPAQALRHHSWLSVAYWTTGPVAHMEGNWDQARDFTNSGLAIAPQEIRFLSTRVLVEYETGNYEEGQVYLELILGIMERAQGRFIGVNHAIALPAIARITGDSKLLDLYESACHVILASPTILPLRAMIVRSGLGLISVLREDAKSANEQYEALKSWQVLERVGVMTTSRLLALLARTMGNPAQAVVHFEDSLAFCKHGGYRPELAWTCYDYADVLLLRNGPGDHAYALSLLGESLALSEELGMKPLYQRAVALQEQALARPTRAPNYPDGLSQREVEVLRLIARGMTDREIAGELVISARTVGNHVSNILNKSGATNRTEAASYATRHGLV